MGAPIRAGTARRAGARRPERETVLAAGIPADLLVFLAFLLLPILGRVLRAAQERAEQKARPRAGPDRDLGDARRDSERPAGEPDVGELEQTGAELWRRLLEGQGPTERPPEVVRVPVPAAPAPPPRRPAEPPPAAPLEQALAMPADPELEALAAIPALAEAEPGREFLLADESLSEASATLDEGLAPSGARARSLAPLPASLGRDELWRAVLWSEILAPPLALRAADSGSQPAGTLLRSSP